MAPLREKSTFVSFVIFVVKITFAVCLQLGRSIAALLWLWTSPAHAESFEARLAACLACHGANGQSTIAGVPSLGGQPPFYLTIQLFMFRERLRVVEPMNQLLQGLGNDELRQIADAIAKLPPPEPAGGPADPAPAWSGPAR